MNTQKSIRIELAIMWYDIKYHIVYSPEITHYGHFNSYAKRQTTSPAPCFPQAGRNDRKYKARS